MLVASGTQTKSISRLTDQESPSHNERHENTVKLLVETQREIYAIRIVKSKEY